MNYYKLESVCIDLNPKNLWYDAIFSEGDPSIDREKFHSIINPSLFYDLELPFLGEIQFIDGVEPRDFITIRGLKNLGIVLSNRLILSLDKLHIPQMESSPLMAKKNYYDYHWIVFNSLEVFSQIDFKLSEFYQGDDYWGRSVIEFIGTDDFLEKIDKQTSIREKIRFNKLVFANNFSYDLFSFPQLHTRFFCSDRFKKMVEDNSYSGFDFKPAKIFS